MAVFHERLRRLQTAAVLLAAAGVAVLTASSGQFPAIALTLTQPINAVAGYVNAPLDRRNALESSFNDAWSEALRAYAGTDLALTPGFRFDAVLAPGAQYEDGHVTQGNVTVEDVYRYFPVPYSMATGTVSGTRLKEIVESNLSSVFSRDAFAQHGGWSDGWAGMTMQVNLAANDGARVQAMTRATGNPISPTDTLTIAGCQRPMDGTDVLCSYTGLSNVVPLLNPATGAGWLAQELLTELLAQGRINAPGAARITDSAATPLWPQQQAVQPLFSNLTHNVRTTASGLTYNRNTRLYTGSIMVSNTGTQALAAPLKLVLTHLDADIVLTNAQGVFYGQPFIVMPALAAGSTTTLTIKFSNPKRKPVSYQTQVWNGGI